MFADKALAVGVGEPKAVYLVAAFSVAVTIKLLGAYIGWRAIAGDKQHVWIQKIAIAFAATGGTSFRSALLTDANFSVGLYESKMFTDRSSTSNHKSFTVFGHSTLDDGLVLEDETGDVQLVEAVALAGLSLVIC